MSYIYNKEKECLIQIRDDKEKLKNIDLSKVDVNKICDFTNIFDFIHFFNQYEMPVSLTKNYAYVNENNGHEYDFAITYSMFGTYLYRHDSDYYPSVIDTGIFLRDISKTWDGEFDINVEKNTYRDFNEYAEDMKNFYEIDFDYVPDEDEPHARVYDKDAVKSENFKKLDGR